MTRTKFVKGTTQSAFLNLLNVPYGVFVAQGSESPVAFDLEDTKQQLRNLERDGLLDGEEREALEKEMDEVGLESMAAVMEKARQFPLPDGYSPLIHFLVCDEPDCERLLTHGSIYDNDGQLQSLLGILNDDVLDTLEAGFRVCEFVTRHGKKHKLDAITLFQEMLAADLALDDADLWRRYCALPEEVRQKNKNQKDGN